MGKPGRLLDDLFQNVEAQLGVGAGLELVSAVRGADGNGQRVTAGLGNELLHFLGTGVVGILSGNIDLVLNASQSAQLSLDHNTVIVSVLDDLAGDLDVLSERLGGSVDHDGGEAAVDAGLAGLEAVAMVQMQGNGDLGASITAASTSLTR